MGEVLSKCFVQGRLRKSIGWECLFVHRKKKLFLSVYVDDFKMAGAKDAIKPMWTELRKTLDLDDSTPLDGNVYLGCGQSEMIPDKSNVQKMTDLHQQLVGEGVSGKPDTEDLNGQPRQSTERGVKAQTADAVKSSM